MGRDERMSVRLEERAIVGADVITGTASQIRVRRSVTDAGPERLREITYPVAPSSPAPPVASHQVLFAGRFERRKGIETLVRAAPGVLARDPEARFLFLGKDTQENGTTVAKRLRLLGRELGVEDALEFSEKWGSNAVAAELSRSAVCAVPSLWESFGYVAAEAAVRGRPVVASRIPALEEVVDDGVTGRLVDPEDPDAWADALADVLTAPDQGARMGAKGACRIRERCDPDHVAVLTLEAYEVAIASHRVEARR
jgi:glycosyltransferase involved in cell wall biosynthesis